MGKVCEGWFIIDHETHNVKHTMRRLLRLKSTLACEFNGLYYQDSAYCQVLVHTTKSESELDDWLWRTDTGDYVGVVPLEE